MIGLPLLVSATENCLDSLLNYNHLSVLKLTQQKLQQALTVMDATDIVNQQSDRSTEKNPVSSKAHSKQPKCSQNWQKQNDATRLTSETITPTQDERDQLQLEGLLEFIQQRFFLIVTELFGKKNAPSRYVQTEGEQKLDQSAKITEAIKLLHNIHRIAGQMDSIRQQTKPRQIAEAYQTLSRCSEIVSSRRSLLTQKLKTFQEEHQYDEVIPVESGRLIIKKNWVLKRPAEKENISEPINSISNISDFDPESVGAYSEFFRRVLPSRHSSERVILGEMEIQQSREKEKQKVTPKEGCAGCQIY